MSSNDDAGRRFQALLNIQEEVQKKWATSKPFQVDAPSDPVERAKRNKFMVTFPYPYMNGALHLGHAFTVAKAEFAVRYQRLKGKKALFPFGFHCTGMPILACAQRLREELAKYGPQGPPKASEVQAEEEKEEVVEVEPEVVADPVAAEGGAAAPAAGAPKKKNKKGKLAAKSTGLATQWEIMRSMEVPEDEIKEFAHTQKWLDYWPPIAKNDLNRLGMAIDWRRTFITTDVNPYYDAFIRWQFNQLKSKEKIGFGRMMCVYSTVSETNCADHDRKEGEGFTPQEYTLVKLQLQKPYPAELEQLFTDFKGKNEQFNADDMTVYLPAATLRPETMYGQTNAFLKPDGDYGVYIMDDKTIFVCGEHSARNMAYQDIFGKFQGQEFDQPKVHLDQRFVGTILGEKFFGKKVDAPLTPYKSVYLFPLTTILMDKGTGVVTSVPSDAPTDYATFMEIKQYKRDYYNKTYGITDEMVKDFEVIDIINIKDDNGLDTNCIAKLLCEREKVTTHKDAKLPMLKDEAYKLGFERGVMIVGDHIGQPIKTVKDLCKADLIKSGDALLYSEPEGKVVSRLGDVCVCALLDQWFLKYGEEKWQEQIRQHVANDATFNSYNNQIKNKLLVTIGWLQRWGCSRAFGLGTKLPFDENFLIESLSDSTIYMAYYTIVNILQGGHFNGSMPSDEEVANGIAKPQVTVEDLSDDLFNYIFFEVPYDANKVKVPQELCDKMRQEFEFWYPHDLRVSGKDLLQNHLVMSLYNHAAVWDGRTDRMPGGYYANGLLQLNGQKMSKSTGNFLTLAQAIDKFGADAVRFGLAASGDSLEDANFTSDTASGAVMKLTQATNVFDDHYFKYIQEGKYRSGELTFWDCVALQRFQNCIESFQHAYDSMQMIDVIRQFHILFAIRDEYRVAITPEGSVVTRSDYVDHNFHEVVIIAFMRILSIVFSPIVPHWTQDLHEKLMKSGFLTKIGGIVSNTGADVVYPELVVDELWPSITVPDCGTDALIEKSAYLLAQSDNVRFLCASYTKVSEKKRVRADGTVPPTNFVNIYVATGYTEWQQTVLKTCQEFVKNNGGISALTDKVNLLKTTVAGLFTDKKIKTNAMKFTVDLVTDFKANESGSEQERFDAIFSLETPFNEIDLWNQYTNFLIRAVAPISASNPDTFKVTPVDPANPIDEDGKALISVPRPGKPVLLFASKE